MVEVYLLIAGTVLSGLIVWFNVNVPSSEEERALGIDKKIPNRLALNELGEDSYELSGVHCQYERTVLDKVRKEERGQTLVSLQKVTMNTGSAMPARAAWEERKGIQGVPDEVDTDGCTVKKENGRVVITVDSVDIDKVSDAVEKTAAEIAEYNTGA